MPTKSDAERDLYFRLLELHNRNRQEYDKIKWERLKFSQLIFGGMMAVCVGALVGFRENLHDENLMLFIGLLPAMAIVGLLFGLINFRRESRLLFLEEGTMYKLCHFLRVNKHLDYSEQWLKGDNQLIHPKWRPDLAVDLSVSDLGFSTISCSVFGGR